MSDEKKQKSSILSKVMLISVILAPFVLGIFFHYFVFVEKKYLKADISYDKYSYLIPEGNINYSYDYNIKITYNYKIFTRDEFLDPSQLKLKKYLTISPDIKFSYKIVNRNEITIKPDISTFKPNSKFTIKLKEDLEADNGADFKNPVSKSIYYKKFIILAKSLKQDQRIETLNKDIFLLTNYNVKPDELNNNVSLIIKEKDKKFNIKIEKVHLNNISGYEIIKIKENLNFNEIPVIYEEYVKKHLSKFHLYKIKAYGLTPETQYTLKIDEKLKPETGNTPIDNNINLAFHTFDRFRVLNPKDYDIKVTPDESVAVRLNNEFNFNKQDILKSFTIKNAKTNQKIKITKIQKFVDQSYYKKIRGIKLKFKAKIGEKYVLSIAKGIKDKYKQSIIPAKLTIKIKDYPPYLSTPFPQKGIFESKGKLFKFPVAYRNITGLNIKIKSYHTPEAHINDRPSKIKTLIIKKKQIRRNVRLTKHFNLEKYLNRKHGFIKLEIEAAGPNGLFSGKQINVYNPKDRSYREFFYQFTNMSITAKYSPKNIFIYVSELTSPKPVRNAKITIYSKDGYSYDKVITKYTNSRGYIIISNNHPQYKKLYKRLKKGFSRQTYYIDKDSTTKSEPDFLVVAQKGKDFCELNFNNNTTIDLSNTSVDNTANAMSSFYAFVFTPKGIYKQSENVLIKGYVRENNNGKIKVSRNKEYNLSVYSPDNSIVLNKTIKTNSFGAFSVNYELPSDPELGKYMMRISKKDSNDHVSYDNRVFKGSFMVEAYRARRFEVDIQAGRRGETYYKGNVIPFDITAKYLHGGLMRNAKVKYRIDAYPYNFKNFKFNLQKYKFSSNKWLEHGKNHETNINDTSITVQDVKISKLDASGRFSGNFKAKVPFNNSCVYKIVSEVEDQDRQSIVATDTVLVHKTRYYVGYSLNKFFLGQGKNLKVNVVTARPDGSSAGRKPVTLRFYKVEWTNVRKLSYSGYYKWHSKKKYTLVKRISIRTTGNNRRAKIVKYTPSSPGTYVITFEAKDKNGTRIKNFAKFWVYGNKYTTWKMKDDQSIDLIRDKSFYSPGESARIMVKSPYKNVKALVTIEREGVIESFTTIIRKTAGVIRVPVKKKYAPNVFVSVMLLQGRVNGRYPTTKLRDIYKPTVKIGYTILYVKRNHKKLNIKVTGLKKSYQPRQRVSMRIKIKDYQNIGIKSEVGVYVVDEGVLSLIGYKTPNPFYAFYRNKELMVKTADNRFEVVGQHKYTLKGENPGGSGKGDYNIRSSLGISNVKARKLFKAIAYSKPDIVTDSNGYAYVTFKLPDNLTKYRIMVIAANRTDKFGAVHSNIRVSKPLIARPALPRFLNLQDKINAGVVVMNNLNKPVYARVSAGTKNVKRFGAKTKRVYLPANGAKEVRFNFMAHKLGKAKFKFGVAAKSGRKRYADIVEWEIPVNMPFFRKFVAYSGNTVRSRKQHNLKLPESVRREQIGIEVITSSTALSKLKGSVEYLFGYPYGCLEQRMTRVMPMLLAGNIVEEFKLNVKVPFRKLVQKYITDLYRYQTGTGGFSIWPEPRYHYKTKPYLSAYVLYIMHMGKKLGYKVDAVVRSKTLSYLKNYLSGARMKSVYYSSRQHRIATNIFIYYILSEFGEARESYADSLIRTIDGHSLYVKSIFAKALFNINKDKYRDTISSIINEIVSKIKREGSNSAFIETNYKKYNYYRQMYMSDVKTTSSAILTLLKADTNNANITKLVRGLLSKMKNGKYRTTQQNMYVLWALLEYFKTYEKQTPDFKVSVYAEVKRLLSKYFKGRSFTITSGKRYFNNYKKDRIRVKVNKNGKGRLYYTIRLNYVPDSIPEKVDNGFSVEKNIYDIKTNRKISNGEFVAGRTYRVELKIRIPKTRYNVVVDDPLAAGFEALNPRLKQSSIDVNNSNKLPAGFNRVALKDDRVCLFAEKLNQGVYRYTYNMKATTSGTFAMFPAKAEEMYDPDIYGYSTAGKIRIK